MAFPSSARAGRGADRARRGRRGDRGPVAGCGRGVPGGRVGAWAAVIITEFFVVVTVITLVWPGAINAWFGQSYSVKSVWGVSRPFFEW
jgi:hypothetical protein